MIEQFEYTKETGDVSQRTVIILNKPSDKILALDVTEFSTAEREYYNEAVEDAQEIFRETIKNLGLGSQYRYFKKAGITTYE
jgi:hypothetical protein